MVVSHRGTEQTLITAQALPDGHRSGGQRGGGYVESRTFLFEGYKKNSAAAVASMYGGSSRDSTQQHTPPQRANERLTTPLAMGRKRASMAPGDAPDAERSAKKSKKRRREEGLSAAGGVAGGDGGGGKRASSREVVLRRAAEGSASPILVSFANQTVPGDMGAVEFRMHEADDEEREGEKIVIGDGGRY